MFVLPQQQGVAKLSRGQYLSPYTVKDGKAVPYPTPEKPIQPSQRIDFSAWQRLPDPPPDPEHCIMDAHFQMPSGTTYEVGKRFLESRLEDAEAADLRFAKLMEGLSNVPSSVCWDCLDPDFNPADRQAALAQFMSKYLDRFYSQLRVGNTPDIEDTVAEALRKHKAFCKEWVTKHYKALTPFVTAPAEVLATYFYPDLVERMRGSDRLTSADLARLFMRHAALATGFASCLQYFSASLEQSRGGRNASYKQMTTVVTARNLAYRELGELVARTLPALTPLLDGIRDTDAEYLFSPYTVDWHDILGQIPEVHRRFDDVAAFGEPPLKRRGVGGNAPWLFARNRPA